MSCSSKSRHIRIKFFWVDNRVKQVIITVKHCMTDNMLAYFLTKTLQGSKFKLFRRVIVGWDDAATLCDESNDRYKVSSTSKERLEDTVNNIDVDDGYTDSHAETHT